MKKIIILLLICFTTLHAIAQKQDKISGFFLLDYSTTMNDRTLGNNPSAVGINVQVMMKTKTAFEPLIKIAAQSSLENDDVYRLTPDGKGVPDARSIINVFAGSSFNPSKHFYLSFLLGPSFINNNTYLGIEPSIGFYFSEKKKSNSAGFLSKYF